MPDWLQQLLLAVIGSASITGGVGWWFKTHRDDRKEEADRRIVLHAALEARVEKLQAKIESLLMDAIAREQEANHQMKQRIEMDARQGEVINAATTALKDAALLIARLEKKQ